MLPDTHQADQKQLGPRSNPPLRQYVLILLDFFDFTGGSHVCTCRARRQPRELKAFRFKCTIYPEAKIAARRSNAVSRPKRKTALALPSGVEGRSVSRAGGNSVMSIVLLDCAGICKARSPSILCPERVGQAPPTDQSTDLGADFRPPHMV